MPWRRPIWSRICSNWSIARSASGSASIPASASPHVWADLTELENAILNLAVNARDAMGGAGDMSLQVDMSLAEAEIANLPARLCPVRVADTGIGIAPEHIDRV